MEYLDLLLYANLQRAVQTTATYQPSGKRVPADGFKLSSCPPLEELRPESNQRYAWTDIGYGRLFADYYQSVARYAPERKIWYIYDGKRWTADIGNLQVMELCKALADKLLAYALSITDERQRKAFLESVCKWQVRRNRETVALPHG